MGYTYSDLVAASSLANSCAFEPSLTLPHPPPPPPPPPPTSFFLAAIIYPVIAHIIWSHHGLLSADAGDYVLGTRGVLDNAGSMVVHVTGGWVAMAQVGEWAWHRWVSGHGT
ncbi:unnamed protein product, partial [Closterium sp. NIES-54]